MAGPNVLALLQKRRERWVDLEDGRRIKFLRPPETDYGKLLKPELADPTKVTWSVDIDDVQRYVCDWEGFSEASLLGPEVGATDIMVPFDKAIFAEIISDDIVWVQKVATAILDSVVENVNRRADEAKNSSPA